MTASLLRKLFDINELRDDDGIWTWLCRDLVNLSPLRKYHTKEWEIGRYS
jgi:hypothetical protein